MDNEKYFILLGTTDDLVIEYHETFGTRAEALDKLSLLLKHGVDAPVKMGDIKFTHVYPTHVIKIATVIEAKTRELMGAAKPGMTNDDAQAAVDSGDAVPGPELIGVDLAHEDDGYVREEEDGEKYPEDTPLDPPMSDETCG